MKIGNKVMYKEKTSTGNPRCGEIGFIKNISKDNTAVLVDFVYADIWCMCYSLEVIE